MALGAVKMVRFFPKMPTFLTKKLHKTEKRGHLQILNSDFPLQTYT